MVISSLQSPSPFVPDRQRFARVKTGLQNWQEEVPVVLVANITIIRCPVGSKRCNDVMVDRELPSPVPAPRQLLPSAPHRPVATASFIKASCLSLLSRPIFFLSSDSIKQIPSITTKPTNQPIDKTNSSSRLTHTPTTPT